MLATLSPSTASSIGDTTHLTSSYNEYEIVWKNITLSTTSLTFEFQIHSGGSYQTSSYITSGTFFSGASVVGDNPTTYIPLTHATSTGSGAILSGWLRVSTPSASAIHPFYGQASYFGAGPLFAPGITGGYWNSAAVVDGFQFLTSSGTFSGTIEIYGRL